MMREKTSINGLTKVSGRGAILSFVIVVLGLALCPMSRATPAQSVTLAWNPSTAGGVAGYMIHYGSNGSNYDNQLDAGASTSATVTGLQEGETNYFIVTAYDTNHVESPPSNETVYYVPGVVQMGAKTSASEAAALSFPVAPGHTYGVQASTDLQNWVTIWQTTAATNGWVNYQDPEAGSMKMRFYRTVSN
jgi:fibronectin type 3 domain-containing protein